MHISLDSALGRQRRLNSVGESVLQIAPDAAAAYSLRSLTGGDPDVVRVRRESDNTEKDFSGSQIESGEMARWVNEQPTLPLDLRELDTNTGERDGALIQAAAAYSLRKLKEDYTGDVVEVRRSSDDAEESFTAAEVADGTLESWVNEDVTIYQSDFSSDTNGWSGSIASPVGNQDGVSDGTTSKDNVLKLTKAQDSQAYIQRDQGVIAGLTYTVSGSFYAPSSNTAVDGILIKDGVTGSSLSIYPSGYLTSSGVWTDFSFSYTATVSGTQRLNMGISSLGSNPNGSSAGSTGDVVYISDLQFVETTSNGHVSTWYDQSGNTNDAVQTDAAKQPKIVEGGTLLKDSNNNPEVVFTGGDAHFLTASSPITFNDVFFKFRRTDATTATNGILSEASSGSSPYTYIHHSGQTFSFDGNASDTVNLSFNGQYEENQSTDKAGVVTVDSHLVYLNYTSNPDAISDIGRLYNGSFVYGSFSAGEFIFYNSDQSDNRTAIEANIGETYGITAIPAANDTVNGYVQTWYDQSGEGNDATQTTASNQPKIVDGGSLVTRNGDAAIKSTSDNEMTFTLGSLSADGQQSVFSVLENDVTSQDGFGPVFRVLSTSTSTGGVNRRPYWYVNPTGGLAFTVDSFTGYQNTDREYRLYSHIMNDAAGGTSTIHQDGTQVDTRSITLDANATFNEGRVLGVTTNATGALYMSEVIYYPSDQSSNRTAIETNIADEYGITLS